MLTIVNSRLTVLNLLPKNSVGAEIGVFRADYSKMILNIAKPRKLYLVDPWINSDRMEHSNSMYSRSSKNDMEQIYKEVNNYFYNSKYKDIVEIRRIFSNKFFESLPDDIFDFIYIDGDHHYEAIKSDLDYAIKKIKVGGLICVDDYSLNNWWGDDIVIAVNRFIGENKILIVFSADNQVVLKKLL